MIAVGLVALLLGWLLLALFLVNLCCNDDELDDDL